MSKPDFPSSLTEFMRWFPDEDAAFAYICEARWPNSSFRCPACGHTKAYGRVDERLLECAKCRRKVSATSGTVMHGARQPLASWLLAAWLFVVDKRGISAVQLQRTLGLTRHETAYMMLQKLRAATISAEREPLEGTVEVDETYVGGHHEGKRGRGAEGKSVVVGAIEVRGGTPGRLRLRHIPDATAEELVEFIRTNVETKSTVYTDGNSSYNGIVRFGYRHRPTVAKQAQDWDSILPHLHVAFSNLKTWLRGTFHGAVEPQHLQAYLNEFVFRYNRRNNLHAAFQTLLGIASTGTGPTYRGLYDGAYAIPNPAS